MEASVRRLIRATSVSSALLVALGGCAPGALDFVRAEGRLMDRTTQALSTEALLFATGTYTTCIDRSGSWSLALDDFAGQLPHDALSVVKDDTGCVLTLTSLTTGVAEDELTWVENAATPDIVMDASFVPTASSFASGAFYANARLSAASFASSFTVLIKYSDDPDLASSGETTASYIVASAAATTSQVPASNYNIDMSGLSVQTDAGDVVEAAAGVAQLASGGTDGERFLVLETSPGTTFADIDAAFSAGTPELLSNLTSLQIPAASFDLVGADLSSDVLRYIVIAHVVDGVPAYQVITVTFKGA